MSIRTHLLLLVLAVWLPAAAGFALLARSTYVREVDEARARVQQQAAGLGARLDQEMDRLGAADVSTLQRAVQALVEREPRDDGATLSVVDTQQRVVARSRDPQRWVGQSASGETLQRLIEGREGFYPSRTLDGVASMTYLSPRNRHGWVTVVALPEAVLDRAARRVTAEASGAAALLLLIGLAGALYGARRIGRAVIELGSAATELGEGRVPPRLSTTLREVNAVGDVLHDAGAQARRAQQHLQRSVEAAAAEAREAQSRLMESQKHEAIGRLSGGLAHDFNNLLQTISTGLQMIGRTLPEGPLQRVQQSALRASGKASDLVRQMLAFGRPQAVAPQPVDLRSLLLQCQELAGKALGARVTLTADLAPELPPVFVDPVPLELALLNLVFNARDAMPEGGRISVAARAATADESPPGAGGAHVLLSVADTGAGMDAATQARAFDPYFTTKPVGQGSGLGLPQVLAFARQSGGSVQLASEPGRGTRVTLVLPAAASCAAVPVTAGETAAPPRSTRALNVLMVEDDALVASVVAPALEALGHRVHSCPNADAARGLLALADADRFDVLLTDVVMPGAWSGLDLAEWCRAERPALALVVATGYSTRDAPTDAVVLRKPYTLESLVAALDRAIEQRQPTPPDRTDRAAAA